MAAEGLLSGTISWLGADRGGSYTANGWVVLGLSDVPAAEDGVRGVVGASDTDARSEGARSERGRPLAV
jgi:hypothetical protein